MDPLTFFNFLQYNDNPKPNTIANEAKAIKEKLKNMSPQQKEAFWAHIEGCDNQAQESEVV